MTTLTLPTFSLQILDDAHFVTIQGRRSAGSTTLLKDMLQYFQHAGTTLCHVYTPATEEWKSDVLFPNVNHLTKVWADQKRNSCDHMVLVLDNCAYDKKFMTSAVLDEIIHSAGYYNTTLLFSMQHSQDLNPLYNRLVDVAFIFNNLDYTDYKRVRRVHFPFFNCTILHQIMNGIDHYGYDHAAFVVQGDDMYYYKTQC